MRIVVKVAIVLCKVEPYSNRLHLNRTAVMVAPDDPEKLKFFRICSTGKFYSADQIRLGVITATDLTLTVAFNPNMS